MSELGKPQEAQWSSGLKLATTILFIAALAVRLRLLLIGTPLWADEAALALNILTRDFGGMLRALDFRQMAPPLYLLLLKACESTFGGNEIALRLPAFLAACAAVPASYLLYRRTLPAGFATLALLFVAGSSPLINYSAEVKPYSYDVFWTVTLACLIIAWHDDYCRPRRWATLAAIGAVAIWMSYASFLVLGGIGVALVGFAIYDRKYRQVAALMPLGVIWISAFATAWILQRPPATLSNYMQTYWASEMLPTPLTLRTLADWIEHVVVEHCTYVMPGYLAWIAGPVMVLGAIRLYAQNRRTAILIFAVFLSAFVAACLRQYPLGQRLCLYLLPFYFLLLSSGICFLWGAQQNLVSPRHLLAACVAAPLLLGPAWGIYKFAKAKSLFPPDVRNVLDVLAQDGGDRDIVYLYPRANTVTRYYALRPRFARLANMTLRPGHVIGNDPAKYAADLPLNEAPHKLWLLFMNAFDDESAAISALPATAVVLRKTTAGNATLYEISLTGEKAN